MTKKEALTIPPLTRLFSAVLNGELIHDSTDWRQCQFSLHVDWFKPLVEAGHIKHAGESLAWPPGTDRGSREQFNYHTFRATEAGILWWASEQCKHYGVNDASALLENVEFNGIGYGLHIWSLSQKWPAVFAGIRDGHLQFVKFNSIHLETTIDVTITAKGFEYFNSLPRLVLESA